MKRQSETKKMYLIGFEKAAGRPPRSDEERSTAEITQAVRHNLISPEDVGARDGNTARAMDEQHGSSMGQNQKSPAAEW